MESKVCTSCKRREAFFFRPYSGEKLCKRCFIKSFEDKVRATIVKYNMLQYGDSVAIAVSGGKDSISLLHILTKMEMDYPKVSFIAVTVDEGIRRYRDEALRIAAKNCRKLKIEHHIISFKELYGYTLDEIVGHLRKKGKNKLTPCAYCGVLRRKALNIAARDAKVDKLATAHTLDDETQTILLNILHGDVLRLAKGKPIADQVHPTLTRRVKPFCEIPERETALYAYTKKIKFQGMPCPYASEAMRNDMRLFLNRMEEKHAGIKITIFKSMEKTRPAIGKMFEKKELKKCIRCGEPTAGDICKSCEMLLQLFDA